MTTLQAAIEVSKDLPLWDQFLSAVIKFVVGLLTLAATWLSIQTALYVKAKFKIDIDATKLDNAFKTGIKAAEEWGNKTLLQDPNDPHKLVKATGEQKLEKAREIATSVYPPVAKVPVDQFQYQVDALLTELRSKMSLPPMKMDSSNPSPNVDITGHLSGTSALPAPRVPQEFADTSDTLTGKKRVAPSVVP